MDETDNTDPVAQLAVTPSSPVEVGTPVILDASGSSDADGNPITFDWSLSTPSGSNASLSVTSGADVTFTPDVVGDYAATVAVADGEGGRAEASAAITAEQPGTVEVNADIITPTTWETDITYRVMRVVGVTADLTIEPGTRVEFVAGAGLRFDDGSRLAANGTSSSPIVMTGTDEARGHWRGLAFYPNAVRHTINHVEFSYAGNSQQFPGIGEAATLVLDRDARVEITNSTITESGAYGLFGDAATSDLSGFSGNTFGPSADAPVYIAPAQMAAMDAASTFDDGTEGTPSYVRVYDGDVESEATVRALDVPYQVARQALLDVEATFTIAEGVRIAFEEAAGMRVLDGADFAVAGTSSNRVVFTGATKTAGSWTGIVFYPNTLRHEIDYATIEYGGRSAYGGIAVAANLQLDRDVSVQLTNSTIAHSAAYGLYADGATTRLPGFAANTFIQNADAPMRIAPHQMGVPDAASSFADNPNPYVQVYGGTMDGDLTISALQNDVPYRVQATETAAFGGAVTIEDGVEMTFEEAAALRFNNGSKLTADGSASDGILMTSAAASPSKGDWMGVVFYPNTLTHRMRHVTVEYGGRDPFPGIGGVGNIALDRDTNLDLLDASIDNSAGYGVYLDAARSSNGGSIRFDDSGTSYGSGNTSGDVNR